MVLLWQGDGLTPDAVPKRQELPPVILPQPIDSTVFLAKEYRPRPIAFLKPFGVHVPRLCTPTSTSVGGGGGHNRGIHMAAEEARLPFDSYASQGSNPGPSSATHSFEPRLGQTATLTSAGCCESSAGDGRALRRL